MLVNRVIFYFQLLVIAIVPVLIPLHVKADNQTTPTRLILKSASELDYPPFALVRSDGSADGFSVDLLKAVTRTVGLEINFIVGPWNEIKQNLIEGHLDVLPLVSYSVEREKVFDFTAPYLRMHGTIFVRKGEKTIRSRADLKGKEVLVMRGDTAHEYAVKENLSDKLILTDNYEEAMKQLSEGKHDAVIVQQLVGIQLLKKLGISNVVDAGSFQDTSLKPGEKPLSGFEQKFCFAVRDGNRELLALLNEGLTIVIANGTYDDLYTKWFSPILPQSPVPLSLILKYLFYILGPILFLLTIIGLWFLKREVSKKTLSLREKIKEQMQAEEALLENEKKLQAVFNRSPVGLILLNSQSVVLDCNQHFANIFEVRREEYIGLTLLDRVPEGPVRQSLVNAISDDGVHHYEGPYISILSGKQLNISVSCEKIAPDLLIAIIMDITERNRTEDALRESEEKFRLTFDFSPEAVNINRLDDGLFVDINQGFTRATGFTREDVIGRTSSEINIWHDPAGRQKLVQGLRENGFFENLEARFRRKDGSLITALMSARVISLNGVSHIISITRDITERKLIAEKLQQVQKFEAIGTLAGGIAHDFNNLLMGIQGRASLISLDIETSHPHREHIDAIEEYIRSATSLTKQLLGFARGGKYEVKPIDINELVLSSSAMFGRTKKEIQIHTKCQKSFLVLEADRGQIEQVLLNMYVNAWQAMPPEGGDLYLESKTVTLDEAFCKLHQIEPGCYVKVSITDTGVGMDEETRLRIFDPFFTTKEKGRGTGLGLASAYGIIKNHGGVLTVYSEIGHGTTFNIYLPVSDKEAHREIPVEGGLIKGSAAILLVDDEEMIIEVGRAMLERLGYRVVISKGGQEALNVITDVGNEIDLVILDMIMPGMDGGKTFDRIREIRPGMPVLLSSGYAIDGHAHEIMSRGCNGFIQKPYNISELSNKVRYVLDERKG